MNQNKGDGLSFSCKQKEVSTMKNCKVLNDQELDQITGQGVMYWVGRAVARACESFTHIYG